MDPFLLVYYGLICAVLGLVAPQLGNRWLRFGIGALVGVGAVAVLPFVRGMIG
ncbi:MAG: hypothetical protein QNJ09_07915 [Paracoccaceae bacterium]|nr:hypothetical protein [Paracoccaceae bacterium]